MNCIYRAIPGALVALAVSFSIGFFSTDGGLLSIGQFQLQGRALSSILQR